MGCNSGLRGSVPSGMVFSPSTQRHTDEHKFQPNCVMNLTNVPADAPKAESQPNESFLDEHEHKII